METQYKIVGGANPSNLEDHVRKYLQTGWEVSGGAFYTPLISSTHQHLPAQFWQTMIRKLLPAESLIASGSAGTGGSIGG